MVIHGWEILLNPAEPSWAQLCLILQLHSCTCISIVCALGQLVCSKDASVSCYWCWDWPRSDCVSCSYPLCQQFPETSLIQWSSHVPVPMYLSSDLAQQSPETSSIQLLSHVPVFIYLSSALAQACFFSVVHCDNIMGDICIIVYSEWYEDVFPVLTSRWGCFVPVPALG